jgi:hypothetical protein
MGKPRGWGARTSREALKNLLCELCAFRGDPVESPRLVGNGPLNMRIGRWTLAVACWTLLLLACPPHGVRAAKPGYATVQMENVPHVRQKPDFCGEACAEMWLGKLGHGIDQDDVFNLSGVNPERGRGCRTPELSKALVRLGFKTGDTFYPFPAARATKEVEALWRTLHGDLEDGVPSIVCMRTSSGRGATEHFRLVLGYDAKTDEVVYHEPAEDAAAYRRMKRSRFMDLWPLKYAEDKWTVIRMRLEAGRIREPRPSGEQHSSADYAQHVRAVRGRLPRGFTLVLEKPFVVVGDEAPSVVRMRAEQTVKWATVRLKSQYFEKDPEAIIDIWLFRDKSSYRKNALALFGDRPSTPFGYFSDEHDALVMNIATGGGTLVHEMVHPFMAANFPACPAWFNEGLASLYEQSQGRGSKIHGMTNWRLAGLQKAIRSGRVPSFRELTGTTDHEFYSEDKGTNYAQARYLCYYLQEKGRLEDYYRRFRENAGDDRTGYETLKAILGAEDMAVFKEKWEAYVLKLRFP